MTFSARLISAASSPSSTWQAISAICRCPCSWRDVSARRGGACPPRPRTCRLGGADLQVLQQAVRLDAGGKLIDAAFWLRSCAHWPGRDEPVKRDHVGCSSGWSPFLGLGCQRSAALHPCPSARPGVARGKGGGRGGGITHPEGGPAGPSRSRPLRSGVRDGETSAAGALRRAHPCRRGGQSPLALR